MGNGITLLIGILFLYLPGLLLGKLLFPRSNNIWIISIGAVLSITINGISVLLLSYSPWGVTTLTLLSSIAMVSVVVLAILIFKNRPSISSISLSKTIDRLKRQSKSNIPEILIVISMIIYALLITQSIQIKRDDYTEFFFAEKLASQTRARSSLTDSNINLVIANHEGFDTPYRMDVLSGDHLVFQLGTIIVPSGEKRSLAFNLPNSLDSSKPVYFYLYNLSEDSSSLPYRKLSIWLR